MMQPYCVEREEVSSIASFFITAQNSGLDSIYIYIYTPTIYHVSNILPSFHSSRDEYSGVNAAL